jgi:hypothetical protein
MPRVITRRKKPIDVDTLLWTGSNIEEMRRFCGHAFTQLPGHTAEIWNSEEHCSIPVPEGHHVVRGPLGELYPLSPAALELTYEPLDDVS